MAVPPCLVLDLDGTLVDTAGDLTATLNDILAAEGLAPVAAAEGRAMVGHGARAMISNALLAAGITAEPERLDNLMALFIDIYARPAAPFPARWQRWTGLRPTASGSQSAPTSSSAIPAFFSPRLALPIVSR